MIKMTPLMLVLISICLEALMTPCFLSMNLSLSKWLEITLSLELSKNSMIFMMMVSTVSFFIMFYSAYYMESYNKKKFLVLTMMFFFSMLILSLSSGFATTMMGWDGLGISSICLIMIYQSKKTVSNTLLTMTFNRVGDVFLVLGLIKAASFQCDMTFTVNNKFPIESIVFMVAASMTKSAQFPLSTWLPAAMSAPTPISAMVHSSTLVTAGVYMILKTFEVIKFAGIMWIMCIISSISMIAAGTFALYEKDLKKIIAFSTMSHISIMLLMISMKFKMLAMIHMLSHALFKTAIFMSAGNFFIAKWSGQSLDFGKINNKSNMSFFKVSALMLTSIPFTVSFYTKDVLIEMNMYQESSVVPYSMFLWMITILTILYSKTIMYISVEGQFSEKSLNYKKGLNFMFFLMSFMMMTASKFSFLALKTVMVPVASKIETMLTLIIVAVSTNFKLPNSVSAMLISTGMIMKTEFSITKMKLIMMGYTFVSLLDFFIYNKEMWVAKMNFNDKFKNKLVNSMLGLSFAIFIMMVT